MLPTTIDVARISCDIFLGPCCGVSEILVPLRGSKTLPLALGHRVLTAGLPGKSLHVIFLTTLNSGANLVSDLIRSKDLIIVVTDSRRCHGSVTSLLLPLAFWRYSIYSYEAGILLSCLSIF